MGRYRENQHQIDCFFLIIPQCFIVMSSNVCRQPAPVAQLAERVLSKDKRQVNLFDDGLHVPM